MDGGMCRYDYVVPDESGSVIYEEMTDTERMVVDRQITMCSRSVTRTADPWMVLALYRYEETLGVPEEARGILGAVWCWEGAMYTDSERLRGDWVDGSPTSFGPFQMQRWMLARCDMDMAAADELWPAASCYWRRVVELEQDGKCPGNWARAQAMTANGMKYKHHGCKAQSLHWKELQRWNEIAD